MSNAHTDELDRLHAQYPAFYNSLLTLVPRVAEHPLAVLHVSTLLLNASRSEMDALLRRVGERSFRLQGTPVTSVDIYVLGHLPDVNESVVAIVGSVIRSPSS